MKTIVSVQKIIKVGDSIAVTIPAKEARALNFEPGQMVRSRHEAIDVSEKGAIISDDYEKFKKQYSKALKNLADR